MNHEEKVDLARSTIDYLFGFTDKSDEILEALRMTGLEGLPQNKIDIRAMIHHVLLDTA
jgi:hypothetical protein